MPSARGVSILGYCSALATALLDAFQQKRLEFLSASATGF
jgi:hypothetical protein